MELMWANDNYLKGKMKYLLSPTRPARRIKYHGPRVKHAMIDEAMFIHHNHYSHYLIFFFFISFSLFP